MTTGKKYNREEISKILKIAAELDKAGHDGDEGLTEEELKKVAEEAGINPSLINSAIYQMNHGVNSELDNSDTLEEDNKFKSTFAAPGKVNGAVFEEVVSEIRATHGGIGKVKMMGTSFEWEQRKRNVGYIQITATPKKDHTKVSINANYTYYRRMLGFFLGFAGFTVGVAMGESLGLDEASFFSALSGGLLGLGISSLIFKNWMKKKKAILKHMAKRISNVIRDSDVRQTETNAAIEIPGNEYGLENELKSTSEKVKG